MLDQKLRSTIKVERKVEVKKGVVPHPSLAGVSSTVLIHIPVSLPLPAAGGQLEAVERLRIHPGHVTPRPAVSGQEDVSEAIYWVPPLEGPT